MQTSVFFAFLHKKRPSRRRAFKKVYQYTSISAAWPPGFTVFFSIMSMT